MTKFADCTVETSACPDCLAYECECTEAEKDYNEGWEDGQADFKAAQANGGVATGIALRIQVGRSIDYMQGYSDGLEEN